MMLHVGMNIDDKPALLAGVARVLVPGGIFGIYDMMQVGEGMVSFPMPWASTADVSAVATPQDYLAAAKAADLPLSHSMTRQLRQKVSSNMFWQRSRQQNPARHRTSSAISPPISRQAFSPRLNSFW